MTKYGEPSPSWPKSRARTMVGWSREATARASCWNHQLSSERTSFASSGVRRRFERDPIPGDEIATQVHDPHAAPSRVRGAPRSAARGRCRSRWASCRWAACPGTWSRSLPCFVAIGRSANAHRHARGRSAHRACAVPQGGLGRTAGLRLGAEPLRPRDGDGRARCRAPRALPTPRGVEAHGPRRDRVDEHTTLDAERPARDKGDIGGLLRRRLDLGHLVSSSPSSTGARTMASASSPWRPSARAMDASPTLPRRRYPRSPADGYEPHPHYCATTIYNCLLAPHLASLSGASQEAGAMEKSVQGPVVFGSVTLGASLVLGALVAFPHGGARRLAPRSHDSLRRGGPPARHSAAASGAALRRDGSASKDSPRACARPERAAQPFGAFPAAMVSRSFFCSGIVRNTRSQSGDETPKPPSWSAW
jgi:hypothetical protein